MYDSLCSCAILIRLVADQVADCLLNVLHARLMMFQEFLEPLEPLELPVFPEPLEPLVLRVRPEPRYDLSAAWRIAQDDFFC